MCHVCSQNLMRFFSASPTSAGLSLVHATMRIAATCSFSALQSLPPAGDIVALEYKILLTVVCMDGEYVRDKEICWAPYFFKQNAG
jgi:hypothetical protein